MSNENESRGERKQVVLTINEKILSKARKIQEETGSPLSRQFELAWVKKYD